ncbi:MAG: nitrate/nitrite transporter NrtS [Tepidiformaceae bacterium]
MSHRPRQRFRFHTSAGESRKCLRHAVVHRPLLRTALATSALVGTVLTSINQGNVLLAGAFPPILLWKIPLTYCVPYCVSTISALRISRAPRAPRRVGIQ